MEPSNLLRRLTEILESLQLSYFVTGSTATISYGEPRFTNDIGVVIDLQPEHVRPFCAAFPEPTYYCSEEAVTRAVRQTFQFNILELTTGMKVDGIIPSNSEFDRARMKRARRTTLAGVPGWMTSPEDIIIKKLDYYREGGSDKHLRDIAGVLKVQGERIDRDYIATCVRTFGLEAQWQLALARLVPPRRKNPRDPSRLQRV